MFVFFSSFETLKFCCCCSSTTNESSMYMHLVPNDTKYSKLDMSAVQYVYMIKVIEISVNSGF